jgi:hypothetical protein
MEIAELLGKSLRRLRENPMIIVPILAVSVVIALLSLILVGTLVPQIGRVHSEIPVSADDGVGFAGMAIGRLVILMVFGSIVGLLGHGMTVFMAHDAISGSPVNLTSAWNRTNARLLPLVLASLMVGILVSLGFVLLIIPGIILGFLLMFTFVALMVDGSGPTQAIASSFRVVRRNTTQVFVFFLVLIALAVLVGIVNTVVSLIPFLGSIIAVILGAVYAAYVTILVVTVYEDLTNDMGPVADTDTETN